MTTAAALVDRPRGRCCRGCICLPPVVLGVDLRWVHTTVTPSEQKQRGTHNWVTHPPALKGGTDPARCRPRRVAACGAMSDLGPVLRPLEGGHSGLTILGEVGGERAVVRLYPPGA